MKPEELTASWQAQDSSLRVCSYCAQGIAGDTQTWHWNIAAAQLHQSALRKAWDRRWFSIFGRSEPQVQPEGK